LSTDKEYEPLTPEQWIAKTREMEDAEKLLQEILANDSSGACRSRSAMALGFVGTHDSAVLLMKALESDEDSRVQWNAAAALGRLGVVQAIDALCSASRSEDENVRANACIALGELGGDRAVQRLREVLMQEDGNGFVGRCAADALRMATDPKRREKQAHRGKGDAGDGR
jgi:HEAT repeat protein